MAEAQVAAKSPEPEKEPIEKDEPSEEENGVSYNVFVQLPSGERIELPLSQTDTLTEVRQFLADAPSSSYMTSYALYFNGEELNELEEMSTLGEEALAASPVFIMKETPYNEHSARMHVRRLRELLDGLNPPDKSNTVFMQLDTPTPEEGAAKEEERTAMITEFEKQVMPLLSKYYPTGKHDRQQAPVCLKGLSFSGWNPPPGNRRLQGDLLYIEAQTIESKQLFITASVSGFFVNQSTRTNFNPAPEKGSKKFHNLCDLLQTSSPAFAKAFAALLKAEFSTSHPFELLPVPVPITPWAVRSKKHTYELNRLDDPTLSLEPPGQCRDWNEEFQTCFEQPKNSIQAGILRDRALIKVVTEFVDAATRGAMNVISKTIQPLNPGEPQRLHMWMYSNIFFSGAVDVRDQYVKWGGDITAFKASKLDLCSANRLFSLPQNDIRPVLTAVVDYRGHRLTAQAIIPGIMQNSSTERIVYGSPEPNKPYNLDATFHNLLTPICKDFHMAERTFKDPVSSQDITMRSSSDSKGVFGADGRRYFFDLSRLMPRDSNYKDDSRRLLAVLRFEFLVQFEMYYSRLVCLSEEELQKRNLTDIERRVHQQLVNSNEKFIAQEKQRKAAYARIGALQQETNNKPPTPEATKEFEELRQKLHATPSRLEFGFNSDFWGAAELVITDEERAKQEDLLNAAGHFLKHRLLPEVVKDWIIGQSPVPIDGQNLTSALHRAGINIRYLGDVAARAKKELPFVSNLCVLEMVARAAKHLFNATLRHTTDDSSLALVISHFLNALLGKRETDEKKKKAAEKALQAERKAIQASEPARMVPPLLTTTALWDAIAVVVKEDYDYVLTKEERGQLSRLSLLRALCIKVGLQVTARDYDLNVDHPFSPTDVQDIFPIVKSLQPRSADGSIFLEEGRTNLSLGCLDVGFEALTEALAIFHQVYGPMHADTATCYSILGQLLYHAGDMNQAAVHQRKAVIVYERVLGLDHYETIAAYRALANYSNSSGQVLLGLRFLHRSMLLSRILSGGTHPEQAQDLTAAAVMLHDCGASTLAIRYLADALRITEAEVDGSMSEATAAVCHMTAFIHGANGEFKEALNFEKRTYYIYRQKYGEQHQRTQESNTWLKQFTAQAVQTRRETTKQYEDLVVAAWNDPKLRRAVQSQLGSSGHPSPAQVRQLLSKARVSPDLMQRLLRGAGLQEPNGAAAKGATPPATGTAPTGTQRRHMSHRRK